MRLLNKKLLLKFKRKSRSNRRLDREIDSLIDAIEIGTWKNHPKLAESERMDQITMKTQLDIDMLLKTGSIKDELDYERALIFDRKLRILG